ncbi:MAG: hypothetical protein U1D55_05095 [Phycisphaerae bacterium]
MKLRLKLTLLAMSAGMLAFQLGNCARFWGDLAGDQFWLRGID